LPPASPPIRSKLKAPNQRPPPSPIKSKFQSQAPHSPPIKSKFQSQAAKEEESSPHARRRDVIHKRNNPTTQKSTSMESSDSLDQLSTSYTKNVSSKPIQPSRRNDEYTTREPEEPGIDIHTKHHIVCVPEPCRLIRARQFVA
jgi:hypothetical protein